MDKGEDPEKPPKTDSEPDAGDAEIYQRETWSRKIDFLLACIGFSVGLGNVWRFPYLCYKNGGGAFLIPYLICVIIGGIPLFFLEVAVGQYMSEGGVGCWRLVPIFQGIGWACAIIVFFLNCYYNVILSWAFYYLFSSFTTKLPWSNCNNTWNTGNCTLKWATAASIPTNTSAENVTGNITKLPFVGIDPVTEFWERKVLAISDGLEEPGQLKWDLTLCLLFAWFVIYFCIWKGIKSSGKVMYFTATAPYVLMFCLLIRGVTLEGAREGVIFYVKPDWEKIAGMQVWVDAGTQIFFSYSISLGTLTALGSYNKFNHNSYRDAILFALTNSGTSIFAGFVIFAVLGYMANQHNVDVSDVAASGPGLAFIAYPKAVSELPVAPIWSILFFFMVILLGLDSQFVGVEGFTTFVVDGWPHIFRRGKRREIMIAIVCFLCFLIGMSMTTYGGMYVFQLFDYYSGSRIILLIGFFECLAVAWVYGVDRFYDNLEMMYGFRLGPYMKVCWLFVSPLFCLAIFVMSAINYSELTYKRPNRPEYKYPEWGVGIGWALAALSAVFVPGVMIYKIIVCIKDKKPLMSLIEPEGLKPHQLRPVDYNVGNDSSKKILANDNAGYDASAQSSAQELKTV